MPNSTLPTTSIAYVDAIGADDDAIILGLRWVFEVAKEVAQQEIGLFVSTLGQVESLSRSLGSATSSRLRKDRQVRIEDRIVRLLTERTLPRIFSGPILAVWVDDKQMLSIDSLHALGVCAIPWAKDDLSNWVRTRNPVELRTGTQNPPLMASPSVLSEAMNDLTTRVNLSTGVGHPSDKSSAIEAFQLLRRAGERFSPEDVEVLAVRLGWQSDHSAELTEIARKVLEGRRLRVPSKGRWASDTVKRWRSAAAKRGSG